MNEEEVVVLEDLVIDDDSDCCLTLVIEGKVVCDEIGILGKRAWKILKGAGYGQNGWEKYNIGWKL